MGFERMRENSVAILAGSGGYIQSRRDIGFLVRDVDPLEATRSSKWKAGDLQGAHPGVLSHPGRVLMRNQDAAFFDRRKRCDTFDPARNTAIV